MRLRCPRTRYPGSAICGPAARTACFAATAPSRRTWRDCWATASHRSCCGVSSWDHLPRVREALHFLVGHAVGLKVGNSGATMGADSFRVRHYEGWRSAGSRGLAILERDSVYGVEHKSRPAIRLLIGHVDAVQLDTGGMPDKESVSGHYPEHGRLGILLLAFGSIVGLARMHAAGGAKEEGIHQSCRLFGHLIEGQPSPVENPNAAQPDILHVVSRNAADEIGRASCRERV